MITRIILAVVLASAAATGAVINIPDDTETIQAGVASAAAGDTLLIAPGAYSGPGNWDVLIQKSIVIKSELGPEETIIDCDDVDAHRAFAVLGEGEMSVLIWGLTVANGAVPDDTLTEYAGSGVICRDADLTVNYCRFAGCGSLDPGGAIDVVNSKLAVSACTFYNNWASPGGAIRAYGCPEVTVTGSEFTGNVGITSGGGIYTEECSLSVSNSFFYDQIVLSFMEFDGFGAGAFLWNSTGSFAGCAFYGNTTYQAGAGIYAYGSDLQLDSCTFFGDSLRGDWSGKGAALYFDYTDATIATCSFSHNQGGADKCAIAINNSAQTVVLENSIIAFSDGVAIDGPATLTCCDIYGNAGGDWIGDIAGQLGVDGNISVDPHYCDTVTGDLRISFDSPCTAENNDCGVRLGSRRAGCWTDCGDADGNQLVNISDVVYIVSYIFGGGPSPYDNSDADCNGLINISDAVYLIAYIFSGGPAPCATCP